MHRTHRIIHKASMAVERRISSPEAEQAEKRCLLIIFTRFPVPGRVKTRLIPSLGEHGAARLHRDMTRRMIDTGRTPSPDIAVELHCDGGSEAGVLEIFGPDLLVRFQSEGDLGRRMLNAFRSAADRGFDRIVLTGTDCPLITPDTLARAFARLDSFDCVLGPAFDGGYYLIGLKHPHQELFDGMSWGSESVLEETLARADESGLTTTLLERLPDIDRPEDIPYWQAVCRQENHPISVIIPVLNEESTIPGILQLLVQLQACIWKTTTPPLHRLRGRGTGRGGSKVACRACKFKLDGGLVPGQLCPLTQPSPQEPGEKARERSMLTCKMKVDEAPVQGSGIETIIVDGGSHDRTMELAASFGARVIHSPPGRARQMNLGAEQARSEILLFLHADTRLPDDFERCIRNALSDPGIVAGAFSLAFHQHTSAMRLIALGANLRSRYLKLPYGDQGIFIRKADFQALGGFPDLPIMEDAAFVMALKNRGRIVTLPQKAVTSARRYAGLGIFSTWLINQCIVACFLMGSDPDELARLYRSRRGIREWLSLLKNTAGRKIHRYFKGTRS